MNEPDADRDLIAAVTRGERQALAALYDKHAPVMLRVAFRILNNRRDAEDLLHDVFLEAWDKAGNYDPGRGNVRSWLLIRVRSRALDRKRGQSRVQAHALREQGVQRPPEAEIDVGAQTADGGLARKAVESLTSAQRSVIELGYFEGLTCREIAERCEIPIGTVKSRLSAAVAKLREQLGSVVEVA